MVKTYIATCCAHNSQMMPVCWPVSIRLELFYIWKAHLFRPCPGSFGQGSIQTDFPRIAKHLGKCQLGDVTTVVHVEPTVFEGIARAVEQLKKVEVIFQVSQGSDILCAKGRIASIDDGFQVVGGDLGSRNVEAENLKGQLCVGEVFPVALQPVLAIGPCRRNETAEAIHATR